MLMLATILDLIALGFGIKGFYDLIATKEITDFVWVALALSLVSVIIMCIKHKEINL